MYTIQVHKGINQIISLFHRVGLWSRGDEPTVRETRLQLFFTFYYFLFPISLMTGAFASDNRDEFIFLVEISIIAAVFFVKLVYIIWNKKRILELLNRIGVYSMEDHTEFTLVNDKLNGFMKLITFFCNFVVFTATCAALIVPYLGSEKKLLLNIGFPLDYKHNDIAYWIAFTFFTTQTILSVLGCIFSILMWYLMLNCAWKYDVLGHGIQNMGLIRSVDKKSVEGKATNLEKQKLFCCDVFGAIESHKYIRELINDLDSFLSIKFLIQIATSGICICCSVYCLAFNDKENFIEYIIHFAVLIFNVFDIFMVMYIGNEIKLSSDRLSYNLFESDWVYQPQSIKKCIIVFGEFLRQPHELVILTMYPITLETFTRIMNSAYNMFNILKNFK